MMRQGEDMVPAMGALGEGGVSAAPAPFGDAEAHEWGELLADRLGLTFPPARRRFLQERLWGRARALGLSGLALYRAYLLSHPLEWEALADVLTVNESRFFREEAMFRALQGWIIPELIRRRETAAQGPRELTLWSAGCSTGEEAYSLAMTALETVPRPSLWDLRVLGTDLSGHNILRAREGCYPARRLEALPAGWAARYTEPAEGGAPAGGADRRHGMAPAIRVLVRFRQHNLCGPLWTIEPQDVIVCQNVLIYFRREVQLRVLGRLYDTLRPGGSLLVGATELPTGPFRQGVSPTRVGDALVYRRT